jgi:hypothetical protein
LKIALPTVLLFLLAHWCAAQPAPARMLAPYVDVERLPNDLLRISRQSGLRYFTLAFVNAGQGCTPVWPREQAVAADRFWTRSARKLRQRGGGVIVAFGGYEGTELAQVCGDAATLAAAYQAVLQRYRPIALDFDIEHLAIEDAPSIERRSQALKLLGERNPSVRIQLTLPATPAGLTAKAMNVLSSAVAAGARVDLVNLMTMDYGALAQSKQMGDNALAAAVAARAQLQQLGLRARLGITPMLGVNDVAGELFTLVDAGQVVAFARQQPNIALLAYWSVGRDNGSCSAQLLPTCSGVEQQPWQFARVFQEFIRAGRVEPAAENH